MPRNEQLVLVPTNLVMSSAATLQGLRLNRTYRLKEYLDVFIGSEFVTSLMESKKSTKVFFSWGGAGAAEERQTAAADTREEGVRIGQAMTRMDLMHHCVDEHDFEDGHLFYRHEQQQRVLLIVALRLTRCPLCAGSYAMKMLTTSARVALPCRCFHRTSRERARLIQDGLNPYS